MLMASSAAPVLSTPDPDHLFATHPPLDSQNPDRRQRRIDSDDEFAARYEIRRTADEIRAAGWPRVALQFPDEMLYDAVRVVEALEAALREDPRGSPREPTPGNPRGRPGGRGPRLYVLADTSYSPCCVDEVAAEHVDARAVVHYGRSCLSPTARLPVVHVFTRRRLDVDAVVAAFEARFPDRDAKVVVAADVAYQEHVATVVRRLRQQRGYGRVRGTELVRDPRASIPNRRLLSEDSEADGGADGDDGVCPLPDDPAGFALFHISTPPAALLLALASRFRDLHLHPVADLPTADSPSASPPPPASDSAMTAALLRRRYARVLAAAAAGVIGILVNTLSVADYLAGIETLRRSIAAAGKKSYTVAVGKPNPAKLANFAEVEAWVVVGCWESALVDAAADSAFWRPLVTPFELAVALRPEGERTWGGPWWGGIEGVAESLAELLARPEGKGGLEERSGGSGSGGEAEEQLAGDKGVDGGGGVDGGVDGEESEPPEFDLRTGRLVSRSRPMRLAGAAAGAGTMPAASPQSTTLARRAGGEMATVGGVASPGADFLLSKRTWQGLGSDFTDGAAGTSTALREGRSGIARGYVVGDDTSRT